MCEGMARPTNAKYVHDTCVFVNKGPTEVLLQLQRERQGEQKFKSLTF